MNFFFFFTLSETTGFIANYCTALTNASQPLLYCVNIVCPGSYGYSSWVTESVFFCTFEFSDQVKIG